jgi:hypothetical protein
MALILLVLTHNRWQHWTNLATTGVPTTAEVLGCRRTQPHTLYYRYQARGYTYREELKHSAINCLDWLDVATLEVVYLHENAAVSYPPYLLPQDFALARLVLGLAAAMLGLGLWLLRGIWWGWLRQRWIAFAAPVKPKGH